MHSRGNKKGSYSSPSTFYLLSYLIIGSLFLVGCDGGSNPVGPSPGSHYAVRVVSADIRCEGINLENNPEDALGPPDYTVDRSKPQSLPDRYTGFVSLGNGGSIVLEMGVDIIDRPGKDIRVYQPVWYEKVGVSVASSLFSPWVSLGISECPEWCDFDLNGSGYNSIRYIKIEDRELYTICYETAGADIDAVEALNYAD